MSQSGMVGERHDHGVTVFHHDVEWVEAVAPWLGQGLAAGSRAVVITTLEHGEMLRAAVAESGLDLDDAERTGLYRFVEVSAAVSAFAPDGVFDEQAFSALVHDIVVPSTPMPQTDVPSTIRVVGEASALLMGRGAGRAALALERLCSELTATAPVSLQCGFAQDALREAELSLVHQIFDVHQEVSMRPEPSRPWRALDEQVSDRQVEIFRAVPQSVRRVRQFVTAALGAGCEPEIVHDCSLIASEMATNAYQHVGGAPFRVGVTFAPGRVRITVEDVSTEQPTASESAPHHATDESGRGVSIVDALADRWGADPLPNGKVVWAEVATA